MSSKNSETPLKDRIDWITVIVPFLAILALCVCFIMMPDASKSVLDTIRFILGDTFGLFYLAVGLLRLPALPVSGFLQVWKYPPRKAG